MKIVGTAEIAEMAGITVQAVSNWYKRYTDFPKPLAQLASGAVFDAKEIKQWLRQKGKL